MITSKNFALGPFKSVGRKAAMAGGNYAALVALASLLSVVLLAAFAASAVE